MSADPKPGHAKSGYITEQAWQDKEVRAAIAEADNGDFATDDQVNAVFEKWATGFSGCDGGDIGDSDQRSIWVCGLEWAATNNPDELRHTINTEDVTLPPPGYEYSDPDYLKPGFNQRTMKLLAVINNIPVDKYKDFSHDIKPFVKGSKGYFKMNLYPVAFENTKPSLWQTEFIEIIGLKNKIAYKTRCKSIRFPVIRSWASKFLPKLIICFGKTYSHDFKNAFLEADTKIAKVDILGRELQWAINNTGTLVVICPFPAYHHGLISNELITEFGKRIRQLLQSANHRP